MGLGFQTRASLKKPRAFGFLSSLLKADDIADSFAKCVIDTPLEPVFKQVPYYHPKVGFELHFHPAAEPVFLEVEGEYVVISAKTSNVGPGYHAFLVSCLDQVERDLGISWYWNENEDGDFLDETEFSSSRDFSELQKRMVQHFQSLFRSISHFLEEGDNTNLMISMPINYGVHANDGEILTPNGPLSSNRIQEIVNLSGDDLTLAATNFLPWWGRGFEGDFYRGIALYSLWMDMRWAEPVGENERYEIENILKWCELAQPSLPEITIKNLKEIIEGKVSSTFPEETGIGYRRQLLWKDLTGDWRIRVPGSLIETTEGDHGTIVFWNNEFVVRGSTITATLKDDNNQKTVHSDDEIKRETEYRSAKDGDGFEYEAVAEVFSDKQTKEVCIVTIWMKDEKWRPLAEKICSSSVFSRDIAAV